MPDTPDWHALLAPACHSSSFECVSTTADATPLRPVFARAPACGSADIVRLAPHKSCPAVAHLPAVGRPDASTVPTSPQYPSLNLRATAMVVGVVAWS